MDLSRKDTIALIRLAIKYSDALNEYDSLSFVSNPKIFKHKFKIKANELNAFAEPFFTNFLKEFMHEYEEVILELMETFREASLKVSLGSIERTAAGLFYSKIASCMFDLQGMDYKDKYLEYLFELMKDAVTEFEKQNKFMLSIKDSNGFGVKNLVFAFNDLSNKTMYANENDN